MKPFIGSISLMLLGGCAFPGTIQRVGVEYNGAVANMSNELTLLNIVRAKEEMPLHYTSVSRLTGSLVVKGSGGFNAAIRGEGLTSVASSEATRSLAGSALTVAQKSALSSTLTEGVDAFTPSVGGEVTTGPTFEFAIYDTQKFYNGVLSAIPFPIIDNYLSQGYDAKLLARLLVDRIEFRLKAPTAKYSLPKGTLIDTLYNRPSGADSLELVRALDCFTLVATAPPPEPKPVMSLSRLTRSVEGNLLPLNAELLSLLDGEKFEASDVIGATAANDSAIMIQRPANKTRAAQLRPNVSCSATSTVSGEVVRPKGALPKDEPATPPPTIFYTGTGKVLVPRTDNPKYTTLVDTTMHVYFRSPEGVIRFLGAYLASVQDRPQETYALDGAPLISVAEIPIAHPLVSTQLNGTRYSIDRNDINHRRTMLILGLVQQLINLQKESTDKPFSLPVQILP